MLKIMKFRRLALCLIICLLANTIFMPAVRKEAYASEIGISNITISNINQYWDYKAGGNEKKLFTKIDISWDLDTDLYTGTETLDNTNFESYYHVIAATEKIGGLLFKDNNEYGYSINSLGGTIAKNRVNIQVYGLYTDEDSSATGKIYIAYNHNSGIIPYLDDESSYDYLECVEFVINPSGLKNEELVENTISEDKGILVKFADKDLGIDEQYYQADIIAETAGNYFYTGKNIEPSVDVYDGDVKLSRNVDYKLSYYNNKELYCDKDYTKKYGNGWCNDTIPDKAEKAPYVIITGINAYKGSVAVKYFNIIPAQFGLVAGVRANVSMKSNRLAVSKKETKPKVTVSIQKWNEKKKSYKNSKVLKEGKDYNVIYKKVGSTEELKTIPAGATGDYIAIVSAIPAKADDSNTSKVEMLSSLEDRIDTYYNKINYTSGLKYPMYYRNVVGFTINDKSMDLSKARLSLDDSIKTVSYDTISKERAELNLKAWQLPSDKVKVEIGKDILNPALYEIYVGDNYRSTGEKRALMIIPTKAGETAGYYGNFSNLLQKSYVLLWSDLTITGIDIAKLPMKIWYGIQDYDIKDGDNKIEYYYDRYDSHSVRNLATTLDIVYNGYVLKTNAKPYDTEPYDALISVKEGSSGLVGKATFLIKGIGRFSGEKEINVEIVTADGKPLKANDIFYAFADDEMPLQDSNAFVDGALNLDYKKYYNSKLKLDNIDFSIRHTINRDVARNEYKKLTKGKDYTISTAIEGDKAYGKAKSTVKFIGAYEGMADAIINFEVLPASEEKLFDIKFGNMTIKGEVTPEILKKKLKANIIEKSTRKKLKANKDYTVEEVTLSSNGIYYAHIVGAKNGGYEGLSVYRSIKYNNNLNTKSFKNLQSNVTIVHKGDCSYLEDGRFLKQLAIEGYGEYGKDKDFYFSPVMMDENGEPDPEYYGTPGNKKLYIVANETTKKCSGSCIITIKVLPREASLKNINEGGYNYILSLFGN